MIVALSLNLYKVCGSPLLSYIYIGYTIFWCIESGIKNEKQRGLFKSRNLNAHGQQRMSDTCIGTVNTLATPAPEFMHQSFVTTSTPPTGKGGGYDFSAFSALL